MCFHVSRRKIASFLRIEKPRRAAQLSECFGAGTGCGWCRQFLIAMFEAARENTENVDQVEIPSSERYAEMRKRYRKSQRTKDAGNPQDAELGPQDRDPPSGSL